MCWPALSSDALLAVINDAHILLLGYVPLPHRLSFAAFRTELLHCARQIAQRWDPSAAYTPET